IAPLGPVYQAGTLSGNPLAMAAGLATLKVLQTKDYKALETLTQNFASELQKILKAKGLPVQVPTIASMFSIFFTDTKVVDFATAKTADSQIFTHFYQEMRNRGVYLAPSPFETGMLSFAHTEKDLAWVLDLVKEIQF
ncbi:MAG: aminotransferase class III-fold pyridoxal phosphate-dependent enzyme, partial [Desulfovibrionaceae bacterium]|nr:aminotransferase class III-fold pyridoxal phosphate-dependent enzyme [Desulfovibrionaceae bacterium]